MRPRRGIALLTGLFLCVVLMAITTVMVLKANENFALTRTAHLETQSRLLAQAAVAQFRQNWDDNGPAWGLARNNPATALIICDPAIGKACAYVQPTDPPLPNTYDIVGHGNVAGVATEAQSVVALKAPMNGASFARSPSNGYTMHYMLNKCFTPWWCCQSITWPWTKPTNPWQIIYPPRAFHWNFNSRPVGCFFSNSWFRKQVSNYCGNPIDYKWADCLLFPTGDTCNHLFMVWRRPAYCCAGTTVKPPDVVEQYCMSPANPGQCCVAAWKQAPPLPSFFYNNFGTLQPPPSVSTVHSYRYQVGTISDLAVSGNQALYALHIRNGIDTVLRLCLQAWWACTSCPPVVQWKALPPMLEYRFCGYLFGMPLPQQIGTAYAPDTRCLTADNFGNLYVRYPGCRRPDTIYKFVPAASQTCPHRVQGKWYLVPPAPLMWWTTAACSGFRCLVPHVCGCPFFTCAVPHLAKLASDPQGSLFARWPRCGIDSPLFFRTAPVPCNPCQLVIGGTWSLLPPPCKMWWDPRGNYHINCCAWYNNPVGSAQDQQAQLEELIHLTPPPCSPPCAVCEPDPIPYFVPQQDWWCLLPPIPNCRYNIVLCGGLHYLCLTPKNGLTKNLKACGFGAGGKIDPCPNHRKTHFTGGDG